MRADFADRVVTVWSGRHVGSGYIVGPRLVLTASHVVDSGEDTDSERSVLLIQTRTNAHGFDCAVVWNRRDDRLDSALLFVTDSDWPDDAVREPVRFGRLTGPDPQGWAAVGYPAVGGLAAGRREIVHLAGTVNPGSGDHGGRYAAHISGAAPADLGASPWAGFSGAAMFCGELLTGIIETDRADWAHGRVDAIPAAAVIEDEGFREAWSRYAADLPTAEPVELVVSGLFETPARITPRSPASLLRAEAEVVPFHGREDLLAELEAWCCAPDGQTAEPLSLCLVSGSGGQGKTRLARELLGRVRAFGWTAGWLAREEPSEQAVHALARTRVPVLLVVDYAEGRTTTLLAILDVLAKRTGTQPLRLLLLARSAGDWWRLLRDARPWIDDLVATSASRHSIPDLYGDARSQEHALRVCVDAYAAALETLPGYSHIPWAQLAQSLDVSANATSRSGLRTALGLGMTAMSMLLQHGIGDDDPATTRGQAVEDVVLAHEQRYWSRRAHDVGLDVSGPTLRHAVTVAALARPVDAVSARLVMRAVPGLRDASEDRIRCAAAWYGSLYPGAVAWGTIEPDHLAEHLVDGVLDDDPDLLGEVLAQLPEPRLVDAIRTLGRTWIEYPRVATACVDAIVGNPEALSVAAIRGVAAVAQPAPLAEAIEQVLRVPIPTPLAADMLGAIPENTQLLAGATLRIALSLAETLARELNEEPAVLPLYTMVLNRLGARLIHEGHRYQAMLGGIAATCVKTATALVEEHGEIHLTQLVTALHIQAQYLSNHEQAAEALEQTDHALDLCLTAPDSLEIRYQVLGLSNTRGMILSRLDRAREALASFETSLGLLGPEAEDDFQRHYFRFGVQINRAKQLSQLDRHAEALQSLDETLPRLEQLAETRPDSYASLLREALLEHALALIQLERPLEAQHSLDRVTTLIRADRSGVPAGLPELAKLLRLRGLAHRFGDGSAEEAVGFIRETIARCRERGSLADPAVADLGDALLDISEVVDRSAALESAEEAVSLFIGLAADDRAEHGRGLARARIRVAVLRTGVSDARAMASDLDEAVYLLRGPAALGDGEPDQLLARALTVRGNRRRIAGDVAGGREDLRQAVALVRARVELEPSDSNRSALANVLNDYSVSFFADDPQTGLTGLEEPLALLAELSANGNDSYLPRIADLVNNKANALLTLDRRAEADALLRAHLRRIKSRRTDPPELAANAALRLLSCRARLLAAGGDYAEGIRVASAAVRQYTAIVDSATRIRDGSLGMAYLALAHSLLATRRFDTGVRNLEKGAQVAAAIGDPMLLSYCVSLIREFEPNVPRLSNVLSGRGRGQSQ